MHEGQWRGRPAPVWTLVLLDVAGAAMCVFGAVAPLTPASPVRLNAIGAVIAIVLGATLWQLGPSAPWRLIHLNAIVYVAATTVLVANAATGAGAMSVAFCYLLIVMYVAVFVSRPVMRIYVASTIALLATGLVLSEPVTMALTVWLTPALACIAAGEVLSWLTTHLRSMSLIDALTGLPNRTGFRRAAQREIAVAERRSTPVTFAVVDLDGFKLVNDRGGHAAGDRLLADLARERTIGLRPRDVVCRLGGDEFVFLLPDTDEAAAHLLVQRLQTASASSWCFGIAERRVSEGLDDCLERADERLYQAKSHDTRSPNPEPRSDALQIEDAYVRPRCPATADDVHGDDVDDLDAAGTSRR